jgi:S1-C subfamily serine protease
MSITADYAKGSSGGPVFNDRGEVVGMVSSTSSLYYQTDSPEAPKEKGPLQMVIKNCVSLPEPRQLLAPEAKTGESRE